MLKSPSLRVSQNIRRRKSWNSRIAEFFLNDACVYIYIYVKNCKKEHGKRLRNVKVCVEEISIPSFMENRMVPCIIIIISYIKHQNNNLAKFSRDTTLLFYHNNNYVSSADFSRNFYYFVLKTNITLLFPTNNNNVTSTTTQL